MTSKRFVEWVVFRHGQTDWNAEHRWQGHVDVPLNELGRQQAAKLAEVANSWGLEHLVSSDLGRALDTARAVAQVCGCEITIDRRLREGGFGQAEGLTKDEIVDRWGMNFLRRWYSYLPKDESLSFPGGESRKQTLQRMLESLREHSAGNRDRLGFSTHGGVLRQLIKYVDPTIELPQPIPNCAAYRFVYDQSAGAIQFCGLA